MSSFRRYRIYNEMKEKRILFICIVLLILFCLILVSIRVDYCLNLPFDEVKQNEIRKNYIKTYIKLHFLK